MSAIVEYFKQFGEIGVFLVSMIPVVELRGAIPAGFALGIKPVTVFILSVIGNMLPVPFILWFIRPIFGVLKKTKLLGFIQKLEDRAMNKSKSIQKKSLLGLLLFVAIPLPGTGAWTGALIASMLNMRYKNALPTIFAGVIIAGVIVTSICLVLQYGLVESGILRDILEFLK